MDIQDILKKIVGKSTGSKNNIFDSFLSECQNYYDRPVSTISELKQRKSTKLKGDIFENFCKIYFQKVMNYTDVWLLKEVPIKILQQLSLKRQDFGIDIIARHNGQYYAIQCKYKKRNPYKKYSVVGWKELSTFFSLCYRTGPWVKYIVITNCDYTRHMGKKTHMDKSICLKTLRNISFDQWLVMINNHGNCLGSVSSVQSYNQTNTDIDTDTDTESNNDTESDNTESDDTESDDTESDDTESNTDRKTDNDTKYKSDTGEYNKSANNPKICGKKITNKKEQNKIVGNKIDIEKIREARLKYFDKK